MPLIQTNSMGLGALVLFGIPFIPGLLLTLATTFSNQRNYCRNCCCCSCCIEPFEIGALLPSEPRIPFVLETDGLLRKQVQEEEEKEEQEEEEEQKEKEKEEEINMEEGRDINVQLDLTTGKHFTNPSTKRLIITFYSLVYYPEPVTAKKKFTSEHK